MTISTAPAALAFATAGWGANSVESFQLYYDGKVWVKPCINVYTGGSYKHALGGWLRYYEGQPGTNDTGEIWTGISHGSCTYMERTSRYYDNLNPWAPPTKFTYGFELAPKGAW